MSKINIIGAGLAGSEAALYLASHGHEVHLFDIKAKSMTPAHHSQNYAEIVCSNSFKSDDDTTASGVFKQELLQLGSILIKTAYETRVPAGQALAIDRDLFSSKITELIKSNSNITLHTEDVGNIEDDAITIIATGPLSTDNMCKYLKDRIGTDFFHFYDAAAPIVSAESIDLNKAFFASRYNKGGADYLNCAMNKDEYLAFYNELINAESVQLHDFEKGNVFESCMPIEILAKRGVDSIRFGPMKPVGIFNPNSTDKPYAVLQLRKENNAGTMFGLVGFQTNLKFGEQKRVFSMIPGLENAEFLRYGVMHTNRFINFPSALDIYSRLKCDQNVFIAGQLSGVEGYVESIGSGLYCAINVDRMIKGKEMISFSADTIIGGLYNYLVNASPEGFQPINANFGVLNTISERDKHKKGEMYRDRSLKEIKEKLKEIND